MSFILATKYFVMTRSKRKGHVNFRISNEGVKDRVRRLFPAQFKLLGGPVPRNRSHEVVTALRACRHNNPPWKPISLDE